MKLIVLRYWCRWCRRRVEVREDAFGHMCVICKGDAVAVLD